jgi:tetratricopeptide (TPR) repeat protein
MREQTLDRLIRTGLKVAAVGIVLAAAVYILDRPASTPSLVEKQIAAGEKAVRGHPSNLGLRLHLAEIYRAANRPESAVEQYDAVIKAEPNMAALVGRGEVLAAKGELAAARASFEKTITMVGGKEYAAVNPELESSYYGLGSVMLKQHRPKEAMREVKKALHIEPADADALYLLGTAAVEAGAYGQAVHALQQAVLFVPLGWCGPYKELVDAYRGRHLGAQTEYAGAMVELCEKKPASASRRLERLTAGPVAVDAMVGLGMAAEEESRRASAAHWYKRVLAADPGNFYARGGLSRLGVPAKGK